MTAAPHVDPQLLEAQRKNDEIVRGLGVPEPGIEGARRHFAQSREWWNEGGPPMAQVHEVLIPGPRRDIPLTVYVPNDAAHPRPAFVYLHGGGYRMGWPRSNDRQLRELAADWGGIVVSADYAHMPEKIFPVAVEETAAVYQWLSMHGERWGIDGQRLAFGGSSAGANVAMGAALQLGGARSGFLKAGACIVGVFDDALDSDSMRLYGGGALFPSRESARTMLDAYAPRPSDRTDARLNALLADPGDFPPLFLAAAELDVFRDSSVKLARHVAGAGAGSAPVLKIYRGVTHLFFGYSRTLDRARDCVRDIADFLTRQLPSPAAGATPRSNNNGDLP
jgi:acetyl esterase